MVKGIGAMFEVDCIFLEPYFYICVVLFVMGINKVILGSLSSIAKLLVQGEPYFHNHGLFNIWLFKMW
jgi:hypothetical protein